MPPTKPKKSFEAPDKREAEAIRKDFEALDALVERSLRVSDRSLRQQINI